MKQLDWQQGEHSILIGETGTGKTRLARDLLLLRRYVVVVAVKKYDDSLESYKRDYQLIRKWPPDYGQERVLYWPKSVNLEDVSQQRAGVRRVLNNVYQSGGWTVYLDDMGYVAGALGVKQDLVILLNQGRSAYISVMGSVTRPSSTLAGVPLESFAMVRHVYLFPTHDEREHIRMAQISGIPLRELRPMLEDLAPYECIASNKGIVTIVERK